MYNPFSDELVIEYRGSSLLQQHSFFCMLVFLQNWHIYFICVNDAVSWVSFLSHHVPLCIPSLQFLSPAQPSMVCICRILPVDSPSYRWAPSLPPTLSHDTHTTEVLVWVPEDVSGPGPQICLCRACSYSPWTSLPCCLPWWCQHRAQHLSWVFPPPTSSPTFGLTTL